MPDKSPCCPHCGGKIIPLMNWLDCGTDVGSDRWVCSKCHKPILENGNDH